MVQRPAGFVEVGRRHRVWVGAAVVVLVAVLAGVVVLRLPLGGGGPQPAGAAPDHRVRTVPPPPTAVWYDDAGLHHGTAVTPIAIDTPPVSLALVRDGVVYAEEGTLEVWYQPWSGPPRRIGTAATEGSSLFIGPGSDPRGTTAAWFDGDTLVMFDTGRGVELARSPQPGRRATLSYQNAMGARFDYVDRSRVVWSTRTGEVWSFDRRGGRVRSLGREVRGRSYLVDTFPGLRALNANDERWPEVLLTRRGRLLFHGGVGYDPVRFSPDGRYLVVIDEPAEAGFYGPTVVDTSTARRVVPARSQRYPWVGWAYGDTLMFLQQDPAERHWGRGRLLVHDARTHRTRIVASHGTVVLPAG